MFLLNEKVKILNIIKNKILFLLIFLLIRSYGKNESSIHEIVKKRKEICATFSVTPQIGKVRTMVFDSA